MAHGSLQGNSARPDGEHLLIFRRELGTMRRMRLAEAVRVTSPGRGSPGTHWPGFWFRYRLR